MFINHAKAQRYNTQYASVSNMSTSAYISSGFGINYYTATAQQAQLPPSTTAAAAAVAQQQQQLQQLGYVQQASPLHQLQQLPQQATSQSAAQPPIYMQSDPSLRRRLFAGFRPLSGFGRLRQQRSSQHRSISLPESNYVTYHHHHHHHQPHYQYHHFNQHHQNQNQQFHSFDTPSTPRSNRTTRSITDLYGNYSFDNHDQNFNKNTVRATSLTTTTTTTISTTTTATTTIISSSTTITRTTTTSSFWNSTAFYSNQLFTINVR